jgi:hypothetical protein
MLQGLPSGVSRIGWLLASLGLASAMTQAQPPHCPRPALAALTTLVGAWKVDWSYRGDSGLVPVEGATATIRSGAGGCALTLSLEGRARTGRKSVIVMFAAPTDDSLEQAYVDSDHGTVLMFAGRASRDTTRFVWSHDYGTHLQIVHLDYFALSPTAFSTETWMSPNGGANWELVERARYRRP